MKKSILITVLFAFIATVAMAQPQMTKFKNVVSLPIENAYWHSDREIKLDDIQDLGDGDYSLPIKDSLVIRTNDERTKAMINNAPFGFRIIYNVQEDERRIVLWYDDDRIYCGYVYDKKIKACQRFGKTKEKAFRRGMNRFGFGFRPRR